MDVEPLRARLAMEEGKDKWSGQNLNLLFSLANFQLWHEMYIESADPLTESAWKDALPPRIADELD